MSHLLSLGAWMPGRPNVETVVSGQSVVPPSARPNCPGCNPRLLRGTSDLTRMSVDVGIQALQAAGLLHTAMPIVFGSAWGEINVALQQLEMMVTDDGHVSPVVFKNSVHNTATGVLSIALDNRAMSTAIAAGPLTTAYALLEAQMQLEEGHDAVLVVVGDEALPPMLHHLDQATPFAAAFLLTREPSPHAKARLGAVAARYEPPTLPSVVPAELAHSPSRAAFDLLRHLFLGARGRVGLGSEHDRLWTVELLEA